jgi:hypothetical protein
MIWYITLFIYDIACEFDEKEPHRKTMKKIERGWLF